MARSKLSRRAFLATGIGASFQLPLQIPHLLFLTNAARADGGVTIAIIAACISIAQALASLSRGSNGLGERLQAMQLSLDAILQTQIETLKAIDAVNTNLNALKQQIPNLFKEDAYRRSFEQCQKSYDGTRTLAKQVFQIDAHRLGERDFPLFYSAYKDARDNEHR
jgi:hypothetical protein